MSSCAYAACHLPATHADVEWAFCAQHYLEHQAVMYGAPWPPPPAAPARRMTERREIA
jgi:hypothetical protein